MVEPIHPIVNKKLPNVTWRFTSGKTTFWNADLEDIIRPIIDHEGPVLTELDRAIITPRDITPNFEGPKRGQKRYAQGGVYDRHFNLLPVFLEREKFESFMDIGNQLKNDPVLKQDKLIDAQELKGRYIYLGILRRHFGHFLLESLSHAWFLLQSDPEIKVIFHGFEHLHKLPSYVLHIFKLLDLSVDRIVIANRVLVVEHLLFPQGEFEIRWKASSSYSNLFRELHDRNSRLFPNRPGPKRVYLTRRQLSIKKDRDRQKHVNNEDKLEELFASRGFDIIAPEKIPFHQQISIIGGAGQIAGLKGSALHMSLFSQRPNARLIQIGQHQTTNQCLVDGVKDMEAHHIFCQSSPKVDGSVVDIEIVRAALREM